MSRIRKRRTKKKKKRNLAFVFIDLEKIIQQDFAECVVLGFDHANWVEVIICNVDEFMKRML